MVKNPQFILHFAGALRSCRFALQKLQQRKTQQLNNALPVSIVHVFTPTLSHSVRQRDGRGGVVDPFSYFHGSVSTKYYLHTHIFTLPFPACMPWRGNVGFSAEVSVLYVVLFGNALLEKLRLLIKIWLNSLVYMHYIKVCNPYSLESMHYNIIVYNYHT